MLDFNVQTKYISTKSNFCSYGRGTNCWISPEGEYIPTFTCQHSRTAREIIERQGWKTDWKKSKYKSCPMDFLHFVKNYIRFEEFLQTLIWSETPTQAQKDKLHELTGEWFDKVMRRRY